MTQKHRHLAIAAILALLVMMDLDGPLAIVGAAVVIGNLACAAHEEAEERW